MPSAIAYWANRQGGSQQGAGISPLGSSSVAAAPVDRAVPPLVSNPVNRLDEKVRAATLAGRVNFLPYLDPYTEETPQMRKMYPVMLRHPVVKQALSTKVESVAQLEMQMVPASESARDHEIADFALYQYQKAMHGGFQGLVQEILYPGLIYKSAVCELVWNEKLWGRGKHVGKRFLRALKAKEFAQLVQDEFRNIVGVRAMGFGQAETFSPDDFAIFINFRLFWGAGMSDLRAAYYSLWELDTVSKLHGIHLEKFLTPVVSASYGTAFDMNELPALQADLALMRSRSWITIPDTVKLESMQLAVRGEAEFLEYCRDRREQIALSIAGAYLQMMTASQKGDIRGDSQTQRGTSELLVDALAAKVTSVCNEQITPRIIAENYAGADWPTLALGGVNYEQQRQAMDLALGAQKAGFKLSRRAFGRQFALQAATDAEDELTPPGAGPGGGPGGGDMGTGDMSQVPDAGSLFAERARKYVCRHCDDDDCDGGSGCGGRRPRNGIANLNGMLRGQSGFADRNRGRTQRYCGGEGSGKPGPCPTNGGGGAGGGWVEAAKTARVKANNAIHVAQTRRYTGHEEGAARASAKAATFSRIAHEASREASGSRTGHRAAAHAHSDAAAQHDRAAAAHGGGDDPFVIRAHEIAAKAHRAAANAHSATGSTPGEKFAARRVQRYCGGEGGKPGPCPQGGSDGSDHDTDDASNRHATALADLQADIEHSPQARKTASTVYDKVKAVVKSTYLSEMPKWALDTAADWLFEETMNAQGGTGSVLAVKAAAFGAAKAYLAIRKAMGSASSFADDGDGMPYTDADIRRLRGLMKRLAYATGGRLQVPSVEELRERLDNDQGDSRDFAGRGRRVGHRGNVARRSQATATAGRVTTESFDDDASGQASMQLAPGGTDGGKALQLLRRAKADGQRVLYDLAARAVDRYIARGGKGKRLFTDPERARLAAWLAATNATAHLLGQARIRRRADQVAAHKHADDNTQRFSDVATDLRCFDEGGPLKPMAPAAAVDYFHGLVPSLTVDVQRFAGRMERQGFSLAATTDRELLSRIKAAIAKRLETGEDIRGGPREIRALLDAAGVTPRNPQYSDMVFRTNMVDAYNTGTAREMADMSDIFPVWRYLNPDDERSRPSHAARNGKYYPASREFADVRGRGPEDVCNDRCTSIPIDRREWERLQAAGARVEE